MKSDLKAVYAATRVAARDIPLVEMTPDNFVSVIASKYLAGYGMAGSLGRFRNSAYIAMRSLLGRWKVVRAGKIRQVRWP